MKAASCKCVTNPIHRPIILGILFDQSGGDLEDIHTVIIPFRDAVANVHLPTDCGIIAPILSLFEDCPTDGRKQKKGPTMF